MKNLYSLEHPTAHQRTQSTKYSSSLFFLFHPLSLSNQYESLAMSSREEVQALRVQLEEQRERARKEMHEVQRHGNDAQTELERSHVNLRRLEEEVCVCVLSVCVLSVCVHAHSPVWPRFCFHYENHVWPEHVQ